MPLANRDLKGIHFAMEFLEAQQKKQLGGKQDIISAAGKDVIIIGGGDTGCDCIATSLRQGAKSITTFEILPEPPQKRAEDNPWPQWPKVFRVDYGHEEVKLKWGKDPRQYCTTTKEFIGENGTIKGVNTVEVEWTKTETGQWRMQEVAGSEKYFPADLILLAMGFLGPEKTVPGELGLDLDPRGNIKACNGQYGTSNSKVFAAGGKFWNKSYPLRIFSNSLWLSFDFRLPAWPVAGRLGHNRRSSGRPPGGLLSDRPTQWATRTRRCCRDILSWIAERPEQLLSSFVCVHRP